MRNYLPKAKFGSIPPTIPLRMPEGVSALRKPAEGYEWAFAVTRIMYAPDGDGIRMEVTADLRLHRKAVKP